jgi:hypothetical protein
MHIFDARFLTPFHFLIPYGAKNVYIIQSFKYPVLERPPSTARAFIG